MNPRIAARGLVVDDGRLLTVKYQSEREHWYLTPGGEQKRGETLAETVRREVREETGYEVSVESLAFVRDFVPSSHFEDGSDDDQRVDHFFWCELGSGERTQPMLKDPQQVSVEWLAVDSLSELWFFPRGLADPLRERVESGTRDAAYLGDIP
ncbi:mutT/NUDIX family protein [Haloferax mucosum ATCC BAA-1512]|uniref:MutT/NUDIX family protein n=1 Tax=Haloferax mucosum ATCC BAA-1512 TaxID=662479 RepID=M0IH27_9EURY|nr:NUDIX domain-containing protein [Haloferax mucosum]ELZ94769.1 mutT/NUDIX family protein [Haloferax mucosum ATCC BAA-1512]